MYQKQGWLCSVPFKMYEMEAFAFNVYCIMRQVIKTQFNLTPVELVLPILNQSF